MHDESGFIPKHSRQSSPPFIGREDYHDLRLIFESSSGFCRVFIARRLGKLYVVKCLREIYLNDSAALAALRKEFDAGVMVDSPYVVRTHDLITLPDVGPAIILEYCQGKPLSDLIDSDALLSADDIDRIVAGTAAAIADIHAAGLTHRDIKPSNIIYSAETGRLKVIDFGFADSDSFYLMRNAGGTLPYIPPHKRQGEVPGEPTDDWYALGVTLGQLVRIAPADRQKALIDISDALTDGRIISAPALLRRYGQLCRAKGRKLFLALAVAVALLAVAATAYFLFSGSETEQLASRPQPTEIADTAEVTPQKAVEVETEAVEVVAEPEPESQQPLQQPERVTPPAQSTDSLSALVGIPIPPDETIPNDYGVCMYEAKYLNIFKQKPFDKFVVMTVDNIIVGNYVIAQDDSRPEEERAAAMAMNRSREAVMAAVADSVRKKRPDGDLTRALGLAFHRWQLYHDHTL